MFDKEEILKMKKWSSEYRRVYQQLYYRLKTEKITATEYDIFLHMKNKIPEERGVYINRKSSVFDNVKVEKLPLPSYKKLDKPVLITFD